MIGTREQSPGKGNIRVISVLLLGRDDRLTKTIKFRLQQDSLRGDVGDPVKQAMVYEAQLADEILFLDIHATQEGLGIARLKEWALRLSNVLSVPLTVGGGIGSVEDIRTLLRSGADRVVLGSAATRNITLVREASEAFGSQCITAAVDYKWDGRHYRVYSERGFKDTGLDPFGYARYLEHMGAGEILLTSISREGGMNGYDLDVLRKVSREMSIPVVAHGGAGKAEDLVRAVEAGASAVAASSLYCFTDMSPIKVKAYMERQEISVRR
mgnify:CR=1 FL=1